MAIYRRAGFAQAAVDKQAIGVWQGAGHSCKRMVAKRYSLSRFYYPLRAYPREISLAQASRGEPGE